MSQPSAGGTGDDELRLALTGLVAPGGRHLRRIVFDQIERRLPRDPESRVNVHCPS